MMVGVCLVIAQWENNKKKKIHSQNNELRKTTFNNKMIVFYSHLLFQRLHRRLLVVEDAAETTITTTIEDNTKKQPSVYATADGFQTWNFNLVCKRERRTRQCWPSLKGNVQIPPCSLFKFLWQGCTERFWYVLLPAEWAQTPRETLLCELRCRDHRAQLYRKEQLNKTCDCSSQHKIIFAGVGVLMRENKTR